MQDKIQEIMGLVDEFAKHERQCTRSAIESKLRELVREPLSHKEACELIAECEQDGPIYILRNTERAHGITNTSGEV